MNYSNVVLTNLNNQCPKIETAIYYNIISSKIFLVEYFIILFLYLLNLIYMDGIIKNLNEIKTQMLFIYISINILLNISFLFLNIFMLINSENYLFAIAIMLNTLFMFITSTKLIIELTLKRNIKLYDI